MRDNVSKRILGIPDAFWIGFLIMIGFFLKLIFSIQHPVGSHTLGVGVWTELEGGTAHPGILGVIQYYFTYHFLPDFSPAGNGAYLDPPFFYIFSALFLEVTHRLLGWAVGTCLHCISCLNAVFTMIGAFACVGILRKMHIRGREVVTSILFLMFFPAYYFMGQRLNADAMCFMFTGLAMNSAVGWYQTRRRRTIVMSAVWLGLGAMCSYAAFAALPAVAAVFIAAAGDGRTEGIGGHFARFGITAGILGLWWPLYNLIRFGVAPFSWGAAKELNAIGRGVTAAERLRAVPVTGLFTEQGFSSQSVNESIFAKTVKSALFSDYISPSSDFVWALSRIMVFLALFIALLMFVMWARTLMFGDMPRALKAFTVAGFLGTAAAFIVFCMLKPYAEAADIRFIPCILFFPVCGMAYCCSGEKTTRMERITSAAVSRALFVFAAVAAFLCGYYA